MLRPTVFRISLVCATPWACFDPTEPQVTSEGSGSTAGTVGAIVTSLPTTMSGGGLSSVGGTSGPAPTTGSSTAADVTTTDEADSSSSGDPVRPLCGDAIPVAGELCFDDAAVIPPNDIVYAPQLVDANGDGNPDLIYLILDQLIVHLGDGAGGFGPALGDETIFATDMQVASLDGDGDADLVVLEEFSEQLDVALGSGSGNFVLQGLPTLTGADPRAIAVGDMDGNGFDDAVVVTGSGSQLRVYLAPGDGTLAQSEVVGTGNGFGRALALGDFSSDGNLDVVFTVEGGNDQLRFRLGDGSGQLGSLLTVGVATSDARGVAVGDFDGDGDDDLALANGINVLAMRGTGAAGFEDPAVLEPAGTATLVQSVDITSDDFDDIIVAYADVTTVSVFVGVGDGTFEARVDYGIGTAADDLATGDANLDGIPDLVVGSTNEELVTMLLSTP
ncbi:MAG: VCBS repeat-containing protein [Myxococcota bacterium]